MFDWMEDQVKRFSKIGNIFELVEQWYIMDYIIVVNY